MNSLRTTSHIPTHDLSKSPTGVRLHDEFFSFFFFFIVIFHTADPAARNRMNTYHNTPLPTLHPGSEHTLSPADAQLSRRYAARVQ
jgi:hypothetical protein